MLTEGVTGLPHYTAPVRLTTGMWGAKRRKSYSPTTAALKLCGLRAPLKSHWGEKKQKQKQVTENVQGSLVYIGDIFSILTSKLKSETKTKF